MTLWSRTRLFAGLLSATSLAAGCSMDFSPATLLDDVRVLAMIPNPIEVDINDLNATVRVEAINFVPTGTQVTEANWLFCPISAGSRSGFGCAVPECLIELTESSTNTVEVSVPQLALECLERLQSTGTSTGAAPGEIPPVIETQFRYSVATDDGASREATARVLVYTDSVPEPANQHPRIRRVTFNNIEVQPGQTTLAIAADSEVQITVEIDPDSMDDYVDSAGRARTEDPLVSYYATAGRFDATRTDDLNAVNLFKAEELLETDASTEIWLTVRDSRGGQSVFGPFTVPIVR